MMKGARMRRVALLAAVVGALFAGESQAQVRTSTLKPIPGIQGPPRYVSPYVGTPFFNSTTLYGPLTTTTVNSFGTTARPIYSGPYHSIYFDSLANTYRYGPGYTNTPNVNYTYSVSPNLYTNPYVNPYLYSNPYLTNPYLYANPYLTNPFLP